LDSKKGGLAGEDRVGRVGSADVAGGEVAGGAEGPGVGAPQATQGGGWAMLAAGLDTVGGGTELVGGVGVLQWGLRMERQKGTR
jgi:hypothetical protein